MRRKIIITGLTASVMVFAGAIIMIFVNRPHTYGRISMILTAFASSLLIVSFYLQMKKGSGWKE